MKKKSKKPTMKKKLIKTNRLRETIKLLCITMVTFIIVLILGVTLINVKDIVLSNNRVSNSLALIGVKIKSIKLIPLTTELYLGEQVLIDVRMTPACPASGGQDSYSLTTASNGVILAHGGSNKSAANNKNICATETFTAKSIGLETIKASVTIDGVKKTSTIYIKVIARPKIKNITFKANAKTIYVGDTTIVSFKSLPISHKGNYLNPPVQIYTAHNQDLLSISPFSYNGNFIRSGIFLVNGKEASSQNYKNNLYEQEFVASSPGTETLTIRTTDGSDISKSIQITIKARPKIKSINLTADKQTLKVGTKFTIKISANPKDAYFTGPYGGRNRPLILTDNAEPGIINNDFTESIIETTYYSSYSYIALKPGIITFTAKSTDGSDKTAHVTVTISE